MNALLANFLKSAFRGVGLEVSRFSRSPEANLLSIKHRPIGTIIDVGANEGQFAQMISRFFPSATLIAFEPQQDAFEVLDRWAATRPGKVKCFNKAVGETEGSLMMHKHIHHYSSSSILRSTDAHTALTPASEAQAMIPIQMVTLDGFFSQSGLEMPTDILVKMDVQGYEDRVISGARETLRKAKVVIVEVCLDTFYEDQARFETIVSKCGELGLRYGGNLNQAYAKDGHVQVIDAVFLREGK